VPAEYVLGCLPHLPVAIGKAALEHLLHARIVERGERYDCATPDRGLVTYGVDHDRDGRIVAYRSEGGYGGLATERVMVAGRDNTQGIDRTATDAGCSEADELTQCPSCGLCDEGLDIGEQRYQRPDDLPQFGRSWPLAPGELAGAAPHPFVGIGQGSDDHLRRQVTCCPEGGYRGDAHRGLRMVRELERNCRIAGVPRKQSRAPVRGDATG
jgi:hypothetical protein